MTLRQSTAQQTALNKVRTSALWRFISHACSIFHNMHDVASGRLIPTALLEIPIRLAPRGVGCAMLIILKHISQGDLRRTALPSSIHLVLQDVPLYRCLKSHLLVVFEATIDDVSSQSAHETFLKAPII